MFLNILNIAGYVKICQFNLLLSIWGGFKISCCKMIHQQMGFESIMRLCKINHVALITSNTPLEAQRTFDGHQICYITIKSVSRYNPLVRLKSWCYQLPQQCFFHPLLKRQSNIRHSGLFRLGSNIWRQDKNIERVLLDFWDAVWV